MKETGKERGREEGDGEEGRKGKGRFIFACGSHRGCSYRAIWVRGLHVSCNVLACLILSDSS